MFFNISDWPGKKSPNDTLGIVVGLLIQPENEKKIMLTVGLLEPLLLISFLIGVLLRFLTK